MWEGLACLNVILRQLYTEQGNLELLELYTICCKADLVLGCSVLQKP